MPEFWQQLQTLAAAEVEATLSALPPPLRSEAVQVPVTYEPRPNQGFLDDGIEPDTLGLFVGPDLNDRDLAPEPIPPQIILFLENLWEFAEADAEIFREEIRTTLLHELGHYLGLDEIDLDDRGLG